MQPRLEQFQAEPLWFASGMDIGDVDSGKALNNTEPLKNPPHSNEIAELGKYTPFEQPAETQHKMDRKPSPQRSTGNTSTPRKRQSGAHDLALVLRRQPPSYVFSEEAFDFEYDLDVNPRSQTSPPSNIDISLSLDSMRCTQDGHVSLVLATEPKLSNSRRTGKATCRLRCSQIPKQSGAAVCIRISAKGNDDIGSCLTHYINLVSAKLVLVTPVEHWEQEWYKDEGGKEKSMEIEVALESNDTIVQQAISLAAELHYDSPTMPIVSKQSILRVTAPEDVLVLDSTTQWRAKIKFRIEDVSKNHQNQNFVVQVCAKGKGARDIAPCFTLPVRVRSKRNKKRLSVSSRPPGNRSVGADVTSGMKQQAVSQTAFAFNAPQTEGLQTSGGQSLRDAIENVVAWSEDVINSLYPLQWQVIGYAPGQDGRPDFSRPYHSMPNPNLAIGRVLSAYTESTRGNLRALQDATQETGRGDNSRNKDDFSMSRLEVQPFLVHSQPDDLATSTKVPGHESQRYGDHYLPRPPTFFPSHPNQPAVYTTNPDSGQPALASPRITQEENLETRVEYVLAKQYKSANSGDHLGFPAYADTRELLGFYRESVDTVGASQFVPIHTHPGFGQNESIQATRILENALAERSEAVHRLKDWGSISNLIDRCLVYDFSKDIPNAS